MADRQWRRCGYGEVLVAPRDNGEPACRRLPSRSGMSEAEQAKELRDLLPGVDDATRDTLLQVLASVVLLGEGACADHRTDDACTANPFCAWELGPSWMQWTRGKGGVVQRRKRKYPRCVGKHEKQLAQATFDDPQKDMQRILTEVVRLENAAAAGQLVAPDDQEAYHMMRLLVDTLDKERQFMDQHSVKVRTLNQTIEGLVRWLQPPDNPGQEPPPPGRERDSKRKELLIALDERRTKEAVAVERIRHWNPKLVTLLFLGAGLAPGRGPVVVPPNSLAYRLLQEIAGLLKSLAQLVRESTNVWNKLVNAFFVPRGAPVGGGLFGGPVGAFVAAVVGGGVGGSPPPGGPAVPAPAAAPAAVVPPPPPPAAAVAVADAGQAAPERWFQRNRNIPPAVITPRPLFQRTHGWRPVPRCVDVRPAAAAPVRRVEAPQQATTADPVAVAGQTEAIRHRPPPSPHNMGLVLGSSVCASGTCSS